MDYLDHDLVGRRQVSAFYRQLDQAYPAARHVYLIQDNWFIHTHPDVRATLVTLSRLSGCLT